MHLVIFRSVSREGGTMAVPRSRWSNRAGTASGQSMRFTHLFATPLTKTKQAGSIAEPVPELNYQIERETLIRTLTESGRSIEFMSEVANRKSFANAVGCSNVDDDDDNLHLRGVPAKADRLRNAPRRWDERGGHDGRGCNCRDGKSRILHFTGHGEEHKLTFEDKYGQLEYVEEQSLDSMLHCRELGAPVGCGYAHFEDGDDSIEEVGMDEATFMAHDRGSGCNGTGAKAAHGDSRSGLQLVFISSCYSESVAPIFIRAGVRHVIAVKADQTILDHKAHEFAHLFYSALLRGDTVKQSFNLASDGLNVSPDRPVEGKKFVLLPKPEDGGDHDVPVFEEVPAGSFRDVTGYQQAYRVDAVTDKFYGRAVEVQKVVRLMVDGARLITITGQKGIGKTQVLLKACAYVRERHVFGNIFFCRVGKAGRINQDACQWLKEGFGPNMGRLGALEIDAVVAAIASEVRRQSDDVWKNGSRARRGRALLVLDGCEPFLVVGQERVGLRDLLSRLFRALPALTVAVTIPANGPKSPGRVGVAGEEVEVIKGLDDRSTAELFWQCCPRKLSPIEMDPECHAPLNETGEPDSNATMDIFSKSDVIRALKGHPSVVQDVSAQVSKGRDLLFRREGVVQKDIPEVRKKYEFPKLNPGPSTPSRRRPPILETGPEHWTAEESFALMWARQTMGFYGPVDNGAPVGRASRTVKWRAVCDKMVEAFRRWVCEVPNERPLSQDDLDVLAQDESLWRHMKQTPAAMAVEQGKIVGDVSMNLEALRPFWCWFWQATVTLRRTRVWSLGLRKGVRGFAGFMRKPAVASILAGAPRGTFLVRFSASRPGALAIHYVSSREPGQVRDVLVNVTDSGSLLCDNPDRRNGGRQQHTYKGIRDLVCSMSQLTHFHPKTPKRELFSHDDLRSSSASATWNRGRSVADDMRVSREQGRGEGGYSPYGREEPRRRHTIADTTGRVSLGGHMRPRGVTGVDRAWAYGEGIVPRIT